MHKILFVRPFSGIPVSPLPLGVMYLASVCRKDNQVRILDLRRDRHPIETYKRVLAGYLPTIVGIGCMTAEAMAALKLAEVTKGFNRQIKVVIGGPHTNTYPKETIQSEYVDILVHGEGEVTFREIAEGKSLAKIDGITFKSGGQVVTTKPRALIEDLDSIPFPSYDLIDMKKHFENQNVHGFVLTNKRHAQIFTSRGCPFNCIYCHNVFGKRFRARSPENVVEEIRLLYTRYGIRDIHIEDDAFNVDIRRAKRILDLIVESRLRIKISFPNGIRADLVDEELADKMKRAGVYQVSFGIESGDYDIQKYIRKGLDLNNVNRAINLLVSRGIIVNGFFMIGFLGETKEQMKRTLRFMRKSNLHFITVHKVTPFPGTYLYEEAHQKKGVTIRMEDINEDEYRFGKINISSISIEELSRLQKKAYFDFYFDPVRLWKIFWITPNKPLMLRHFIRLVFWK